MGASPSCIAFLVKYCVRYLVTRLFKHLKTRMHLCIFLLEARFNQFSPRKVSFEVFFRNIIRAAWFCLGGVTLCNTPLRFPPTHDNDVMMMMMMMIIIIISLDFPRVDIFHLLFPWIIDPCSFSFFLNFSFPFI